MTWGQMRLVLNKEFPQLDLELLNFYLSASYNAILGEREWAGLEASLILTTVAPYFTGTVDVNNGDELLAGVGTVWTAAMIGRKMRIGVDAEWYTVVAVPSETIIQIDRPYSGETVTGSEYDIFQDVYPLPLGVRQIDCVTGPWLGAELSKTAENDMVRADVGLTARGHPLAWAPGPDTTELAGQQVRQIRVAPIPDGDYQLVIDYTKSVTGFDGTNTGDSPVVIVDSAAIMAGARQQCLLHPMVNQPTLASSQEGLRQIALASMRQQDAARRNTTRLTVTRQPSTEDTDNW